MAAFSEFALTIIASGAVSAILLVALAWLLRTWIGSRLSAGIRYEYDERLAELGAKLKQQGEAATTQLRAEYDRLSDRLRLSAQSLGEVQKATIERRLAAIEIVWQGVLTAHQAWPSALTFLDVLRDDEYPSALTNPKLGPLLKSIDHFSIIDQAQKATTGVASKRPFVGEYLWALSSTHQAVVFRMIYLVSEWAKEPSKSLWFKDGMIRRYVQAALGEAALKEFDSLGISRVSWIRERFTREILRAMDSLIAGREFGEAMLNQAEKMEAILADPQRHK